jgi:hypothetical protein
MSTGIDPLFGFCEVHYLLGQHQTQGKQIGQAPNIRRISIIKSVKKNPRELSFWPK